MPGPEKKDTSGKLAVKVSDPKSIKHAAKLLTYKTNHITEPDAIQGFPLVFSLRYVEVAVAASFPLLLRNPSQ